MIRTLISKLGKAPVSLETTESHRVDFQQVGTECCVFSGGTVFSCMVAILWGL